MALKFYTGQKDYIPKLNELDAAFVAAMSYIAGSTATPFPLGVATAGTSGLFSRSDHVHSSNGVTQAIGDNTSQYATTSFVQLSTNTTLTKNVVGGITLSVAEAFNPIVSMVGTLTANVSVIVPVTSRLWLFLNNTTGAFTVTVKTTAGSGVIVAQGANRFLYANGVSVVGTDTDMSGASLDGTLGGTISGAVTVTSDLVVGGNLVINGTTTTVNSTTTTLRDPILTLGGNVAPTVNDAKDRGIEYRWHNGTVGKVGFFGYKDSTGKFTFIPDAVNNSEVFSGATGTISASVDGTATNVTGVVAVANGGTGATTAPTALVNLGAAPLASPALTGLPTAPTASTTTNSTQLATTGFVQSLRDITGGLVSLTLFKINFKNALNTSTSFFTNSNTAARTYTFQDRDGIVADNTDLALKANLVSPVLTGTPTSTTATAGDSTANIATTAFVTAADNLKANLASPALTGTPTAPTALTGDNTTTLATTAFVSAAGSLKANLLSPALTGVPTAPTAVAGDSTTALATTAFVTTAGSFKANLASPVFTGTPTLPTGTTGVTQVAATSTTTLATTEFVTTADNLKANLASPTFSGTPTLPTGTVGVTQAIRNSTTALATTAYVIAEISNDAVLKTSTTGAAQVPAGTTAQRDGTPAAGYIRFNSTLNQYEGYNGTVWAAIGGGATGAPGNSVFIENDQTVTGNYTLTAGKNAHSAGPISIADGIVVTIPTGAVWTIS